MGHSRPLLLYFRLFKTADSKQMLDKSLPMPGFELQISGFEGDRSTTEPQPLPKGLPKTLRAFFQLCSLFQNESSLASFSFN